MESIKESLDHFDFYELEEIQSYINDLMIKKTLPKLVSLFLQDEVYSNHEIQKLINQPIYLSNYSGLESRQIRLSVEISDILRSKYNTNIPPILFCLSSKNTEYDYISRRIISFLSKRHIFEIEELMIDLSTISNEIAIHKYHQKKL
jgi:hypothetical protein